MGIVERLREHNEPPFDYIAHEAADMIEQLCKILEDVLETSGDQIPYGTVKAIRSALKEKE